MKGIKYSILLTRMLCFIPLLFIALNLSAQNQSATCCPEIEAALKQKDFQTSLKLIREKFDQSEVVSGDILYYYGQTLAGLQDFARARNAYEEYLKDTANTSFRKQAVQNIESLNGKICSICHNTGFAEVLSDCGKCLGTGHLTRECTVCKKEGKVACSTCQGKGILLKEGNMGKVFQECSSCKGKGAVNCKKCDGKKNYSVDCDICFGKGRIPSKKVCNHHQN